MKTVYGILCYVCFFTAAAATLADNQKFCVNSQGENNQTRPNYSWTIESNWSKESGIGTIGIFREGEKAASLEIITMQGCGACNKMKNTTIPALLEAGYTVTVIDYDDSDRNPRLVPALFYLNNKNEVIGREIGFQTFDHIVKRLNKKAKS